MLLIVGLVMTTLILGKKVERKPIEEVSEVVAPSPEAPRERDGGNRIPASWQIRTMTGKDWEKEFTTSHKDLDPEFKQEIVMLAGELQDAVKGGLDPNGEEAGAYVTTIAILLTEKQTATP